MATAAKRAIKQIEHSGEDITDALSHQIAALRKEIASIAKSVNGYSGSTFEDVQQGAEEFVEQVRHQGAIAARQISKQANVAGQAVRENPIPVIVTLGTIALISALIFSRD